jgi:hypothetical protein
MIPRARSSMLIAVCVPMILALSACTHHEGSKAGSDVWSGLIAMPPSDGLTVNELQQQTGFQLMLPSQLPEEMKTYEASSDSLNDRFLASVRISPAPSPPGAQPGRTKTPVKARPAIEITERLHKPNESADDPYLVQESRRVGNTLVTCHIEPNTALWAPPGAFPTIPDMTPLPPEIWPPSVDNVVNPSYVCHWETKQLDVSLEFHWLLDKPVHGLITSDMRDEAINVVTSMIEDPYVP